MQASDVISGQCNGNMHLKCCTSRNNVTVLLNSQAIAINPKFCKAYLHRAMAYEGLEKWQKAADDYKMAMELEPGTQAATEGYRRAATFAKECM